MLPGPPRSCDVLVGRGFQYEHHPGNVMFYDEIERAVDEYREASSKRQKSAIVKRIYIAICDQGDFVQIVSDKGDYKLVTEPEAKQKISHALRYKLQQSRLPSRKAKSDGEPKAAGDDEASLEIPNASKRSAEGELEEPRGARNRARVDPNMDSSFELFSWTDIESVLGTPEEYSTQSIMLAGGAPITEQTLVGNQGPYTFDSTYSTGSSSQESRLVESKLQRFHSDKPDHTNPAEPRHCPAGYPFPPIAVGIDEISQVGGSDETTSKGTDSTSSSVARNESDR